ncbi:hypothetical protein FA10DRAFT_297320 [Acaromyces ingoldii]|uniref:Uncharacterized protein n=1 Tax=Acaromyces ingoldii TaxID=215250 RepID=A0A316YCH9_9BASI|nr:hypothetical protein FA10DRAFT_297320 [Acaromyces ingoldii]PWN86962.1 hypothetical protein FA10DRAFT_297320 [Acaromyces ingoldii]
MSSTVFLFLLFKLLLALVHGFASAAGQAPRSVQPSSPPPWVSTPPQDLHANEQDREQWYHELTQQRLRTPEHFPMEWPDFHGYEARLVSHADGGQSTDPRSPHEATPLESTASGHVARSYHHVGHTDVPSFDPGQSSSSERRHGRKSERREHGQDNEHTHADSLIRDLSSTSRDQRNEKSKKARGHQAVHVDDPLLDHASYLYLEGHRDPTSKAVRHHKRQESAHAADKNNGDGSDSKEPPWPLTEEAEAEYKKAQKLFYKCGGGRLGQSDYKKARFLITKEDRKDLGTEGKRLFSRLCHLERNERKYLKEKEKKQDDLQLGREEHFHDFEDEPATERTPKMELDRLWTKLGRIESRQLKGTSFTQDDLDSLRRLSDSLPLDGRLLSVTKRLLKQFKAIERDWWEFPPLRFGKEDKMPKFDHEWIKLLQKKFEKALT